MRAAQEEIERLNAARHADSQRMMRMSDEYEAAQDEIERLLSENDKLCKSVIFWRGKADEIAAALSSHKESKP